MSEPLIPTLFTRHNIYLHALLVENQAWFCAHDLGRLMGKFLDERMSRKLDADQRQLMFVYAHGAAEERLMVSQSGVYALVVYHYCPEYRLLREWLTHQVVPALSRRENIRPRSRAGRPVAHQGKRTTPAAARAGTDRPGQGLRASGQSLSRRILPAGPGFL